MTPGTHRSEQVILCGPFPCSHLVGGYARANELTATSFLDEEFGVRRLPITVPGEGSFPRRMVTDVWRTWRCLRSTTAPIFHLTAQYHRGTYREWTQFRMARRWGRRFVFDIRAGDFVRSYEEPGNRRQRQLLEEMLRRADAITVEGRPYVDWIRRTFGREALWFPNFVQARHRDLYPRAPLEPPRGRAPFRVVYSGRLVPGKGLEELIRACGRAAREHSLDVLLDLAGPGEGGYEAPLRRIAEENAPGRVVFHGRLEHHDLLRLLAENHLFAFPSRWHGEGHSNAVNEAMQVGLPVVTTSQGFLADVVSPECGIRISEVTEEALLQALLALLGDWERLRRCGEAAWKRVYTHFSDEVVLSRLAELYRRLLEAPPGPS